MKVREVVLEYVMIAAVGSRHSRETFVGRVDEQDSPETAIERILSATPQPPHPENPEGETPDAAIQMIGQIARVAGDLEGRRAPPGIRLRNDCVEVELVDGRVVVVPLARLHRIELGPIRAA